MRLNKPYSQLAQVERQVGISLMNMIGRKGDTLIVSSYPLQGE
jgi:hypothetical protein